MKKKTYVRILKMLIKKLKKFKNYLKFKINKYWNNNYTNKKIKILYNKLIHLKKIKLKKNYKKKKAEYLKKLV